MKKTNKFIIFIILIVLASPLFNYCKKGEEDPIVSLKSRKSRLIGEWHLTSGRETFITGMGTNTSVFDGVMVTHTTDGSNPVTHNYTKKTEFLKDNSFKLTITDDGNIILKEGYWAFMDGYDEIADKECIVVRIKSQTSGGTTQSWSGDDMPISITRFSKLSDKEYIVEYNGTTISGGTTTTMTRTFTNTKK